MSIFVIGQNGRESSVWEVGRGERGEGRVYYLYLNLVL